MWITFRLKVENHDWVIYVVDIGQEGHFNRLFKAAKAIGWYTPPLNRVDHVAFGLVQGEDGKKFKTRSGDVVKLVDLLDEAVFRALKEIENRRAEEGGKSGTETPSGSESSPSTGEPEMSAQEAAEAIGYSAIRYFDLKQNRVTNYKFSYDKMLDPKGKETIIGKL